MRPCRNPFNGYLIVFRNPISDINVDIRLVEVREKSSIIGITVQDVGAGMSESLLDVEGHPHERVEGRVCAVQLQQLPEPCE